MQYLRERHDAEGAKELREALSKGATLLCAYGALAGYEMRRGHYGDVHALAAKALAIDAYDAEANYLDGFAFFVEGDGVTARERLGVAALSPGHASAALSLVARSYLKEANRKEALRAAEKALQYNSDNFHALLVRIGIVALLGTEQVVGADVLIGPQRRSNVPCVVRAFRRDGDIPPYQTGENGRAAVWGKPPYRDGRKWRGGGLGQTETGENGRARCPNAPQPRRLLPQIR